ncbi:MAG: hypothetical protein ACKVPX_16215 [Myxococcaceae bacterium]
MTADSQTSQRIADDIQRLWFNVTRNAWTVLAVMSADGESSSEGVARALAQAGSRARLRPVRFVNGHGVELLEAANLISRVMESSDEYSATIVGLDSPLRSPASIPVAMAADAVVLTVSLGHTRGQDAKKTLDLLGSARVLGTVAIGPKPLHP